jgi:transcriptional regulator with XRE-family HTH domain
MPQTPNNLDKHIGLRLKMRRIVLNMTQDDLAQKLGITFQQVQKYEKSLNRISASRLYEIACILNTDIGYFFEGYVHHSFVKENIAVDTVKNYIKTLENKETLNNNDIIVSLMTMPASDNKKYIFQFLKENIVTL